MFLPANGLPKRARFLAILGLIFLTLIHVSLGFLEGDRAPKLKASLRPFFSSCLPFLWPQSVCHDQNHIVEGRRPRRIRLECCRGRD